MWSAPAIVTPPAVEPVTLDLAKQFLRLDVDDDGFDVELGALIAGVRGDIEAITSTRMIRQTVKLRADSFDDLAGLPIGPVQSVVSITYRDRAGVACTVEGDAVELVGDRLELGLRLADGGRWPSAMAEGIVVELAVGYGDDGAAVPPAVLTGMLLQIRALFDGTTADIERWLVNDRIWL